MSLTRLIYNTSKENDREQWRCSLAGAGFALVNGSFEEGATVNSKTDVVWHISGGQCYAWHGEFPKDISAGTTPVGVAAWEPQTDLKDRWLYEHKLQRTDPFGDIKSDGTVAQALSNLDIGPASLTTPGLVRLTSSRVSGAEDIAATANAVAQNYSDMKGLFGKCGMKSRNLGVVYTNSQSFAIFVSVNAVISDGGSFLSADVNVDGNWANFHGNQTTNLVGQRATIAFMVPAGATYIVRQASGTVSNVTWAEVDKK